VIPLKPALVADAGRLETVHRPPAKPDAVPGFFIDPPQGNPRLESREEWRVREAHHVVY